MGKIGRNTFVGIWNVEALVDCVVGLTTEKGYLTKNLFQRKVMVGAPESVRIRNKVYKQKYLFNEQKNNSSAISWTRSMFFVSHTTIAGKLVSQSR